MAAFSDYLEKRLLEHALGVAPYTTTTNVFVSLHSSDPTDANLTVTELSGSGYTRHLATFDNVTLGSGTTQNNNDLNFGPASANWGTVTHIGIYDALTDGNLLFHAPLGAPKTVDNGDALKIAIGALVISLD